MKRIASLLLLLCLPGLALAAPRITGIRHWSAPDHTRVVLDITGSYSYSISTRHDPERIVIDIPSGSFRCATDPRGVEDQVVGHVRCNKLGKGAQVVLDLKGELRFKYFALDAIKGEKPQRVVVDVFHEPRDQARAEAKKTPSAAAKTPPRPAKQKAAQPARTGPFLREVVVVIDPGHGGEDPGAIHKGQREKNITLDIARRMKRLVDAKDGYKAVLTRDGDYTVSLGRRRRLAEKAGGDILVSIHCNTAPNRHAYGVEIFYLSTRGASSRRAQALANLENRADLVGGIHYPRASKNEMKLVLDERLKTSLRRSNLVGGIMRDRAYRSRDLKARGVKRAAFAICKMVSMPSILVETGFLSNSKDFAKLSSKEGRERYAQWMTESVDAYFRKYPSTLYDPLFSRKDKLVYKVKRGDNLSRIASRFDVSVNDLVRANGLKRANHLNVGQLLLVVADEAQPVVHKVRSGENLTLIARRYGVSIDSLVEANHLSRKNMLRVGQELVVLPGSVLGAE